MKMPRFSYQVISRFVSMDLSSAPSFAIRALARDPWVRLLFTVTFCAREGSFSKTAVCFSVGENGTTQPTWKQCGELIKALQYLWLLG